MTVHSTKFAKQLILGGLTYTCLIPGGVHETVGNTPNHNLERVAYFRERYKNLTPARGSLGVNALGCIIIHQSGKGQR
jgi:hypothetical protein